jgi:hypothetical protein
VFRAAGGDIEAIVDGGDVFDSIRGTLCTNAGELVFYATPRGGDIGIYRGPGAERILAVGDALLGSTVTLFVLNPVSINERGQLAIRVELADGRQAVVRAEPR